MSKSFFAIETDREAALQSARRLGTGVSELSGALAASNCRKHFPAPRNFMADHVALQPNPMVAGGPEGEVPSPLVGRSATAAGGSAGLGDAESSQEAAQRASSGGAASRSTSSGGAASRTASSGGTTRLKIERLPAKHAGKKTVYGVPAKHTSESVYEELLKKANVPGALKHVHVDHDGKFATLICSDDADAIAKLKEAAKALARCANDGRPAVEELSSVTVYPRITINKLASIDSAAQQWEGDVTVELLCIVDAPAKTSSAAEIQVADASTMASSEKAAEAGVKIQVAGSWIPYPLSMRCGGGKWLRDLHLDAAENKRQNKEVESLVNYKAANFESVKAGDSGREKWAALYLYHVEAGVLQSVFSVFERFSGRFAQRFELANFPLDVQMLRVDIEAARAEQFSFWKPAHEPLLLLPWLEDWTKNPSDEESAAYRKDKGKPFMWPWTELVQPAAAQQTATAKAQPASGSFVVVKEKAMPVFSEWQSFGVVQEHSSKTPAEHSRSGAMYDKYVFEVAVARRPLRVLVSKALPTFLMVSSAFSAETLAPSDAASRLQIIIALMLSVVFLNADTSSNFEELTLVSKYAISSLVVLVLCILEVSIAKALEVSPWSEDPSASLGGVNPAAVAAPRAVDVFVFDFVAWQVLLALWLAVNAAVLATALRLYRHRFSLHERDEKHKRASTLTKSIHSAGGDAKAE